MKKNTRETQNDHERSELKKQIAFEDNNKENDNILEQNYMGECRTVEDKTPIYLPVIYKMCIL